LAVIWKNNKSRDLFQEGCEEASGIGDDISAQWKRKTMQMVGHSLGGLLTWHLDNFLGG
jgi:triacylglycerol esterase/lipase EstA (alpha/beta hydrolase family)